VQLLEQTAQFSYAGAGIQLGPNVTRILHAWGLERALAEVAVFPQWLQVHDAASGRCLGRLELGERARQRYGAPYATLHRADAHRLLLTALPQTVALHTDQQATRFAQSGQDAVVHTQSGAAWTADLLVGADGLWSPLRQWLLADGAPTATGHQAFRALVAQRDLPVHLRSQQVTVWLGPQMHTVQYPVGGGTQLNVVVILHARSEAALDQAGWDHAGEAAFLQQALGPLCAPLTELVHAIPDWRRWILHDRPPLRGPQQLASGRVALLGDAAHPMRPYLAQGAGMAIEDAVALGHQLAMAGHDGAAALRAYAQGRWQRNARVQARARRNGRIFHATGALAWGRNLGLRLLGDRALDVPWLYGYRAGAII
jgi:salicylate hydroxylase